jgi:hypothetical protein
VHAALQLTSRRVRVRWDDVVAYLRATGREVDDEDRERREPLRHEHIKMLATPVLGCQSAASSRLTRALAGVMIIAV